MARMHQQTSRDVAGLSPPHLCFTCPIVNYLSGRTDWGENGFPERDTWNKQCSTVWNLAKVHKALITIPNVVWASLGMMPKHLKRGRCALKHWILELKFICFTSNILDSVVDIVQGHQIVCLTSRWLVGSGVLCVTGVMTLSGEVQIAPQWWLSHPWLTLQTTAVIIF